MIWKERKGQSHWPLEVINNVSQLNGRLCVNPVCQIQISFKFYSGIVQPRHYHDPQHITMQAEPLLVKNYLLRKKINKKRRKGGRMGGGRKRKGEGGREGMAYV